MTIAHTRWLLGLALVAATLVLGACTGAAGDQDTTANDAVLVAEQEVAAAAETATPGQADQLDAVETEATDAVEATEPVGPIDFVEPVTRWITSGKLLGLPVFASDGLQLGRVADVLFLEQGELRYVVISAPDALGEDALAAVPWESLQVQGPEGDLSPGSAEPAETGEEGLLNAPDPYVVFVYPSLDELHNETQVEERLFRDGALFASEEILAALGEDDGENTATREAVQNRMLRLSQFEEFDLTDYAMLNQDAEQVGEVEELIIDLQAGTVVYALVETGGFLGVGQASLAVPWDALSLSLTTEEFVLLAPGGVLADAPPFDADAWVNGPGSDAWNEPVDEYWAEF